MKRTLPNTTTEMEMEHLSSTSPLKPNPQLNQSLDAQWMTRQQLDLTLRTFTLTSISHQYKMLSYILSPSSSTSERQIGPSSTPSSRTYNPLHRSKWNTLSCRYRTQGSNRWQQLYATPFPRQLQKQSLSSDPALDQNHGGMTT